MNYKSLLTYLALLPLLTVSVLAQAIDKPTGVDSESFLKAARKNLLGNCWIKLDGQINITRDGARVRPMILKCAAQLIPNKITFKATIQKSQSFKVEHIFGKKHDTKILENTLGKDNGFKQVGLKPSDLSLAFMYWDFIKEYPNESLGVVNQFKCRVYLLGNPDGGEYVKVWLSTKFKAPFQVEWYDKNTLKEKKPLQTLVFDDFAEKNKVWIPLEINVTNKKGTLQVKFDIKKVDAAFSRTVPKDLYKTEN